MLTIVNEDRNAAAARHLIADQRAMFGDAGIVEQLLSDIKNPDFDALTAYRDDQAQALILTQRSFPETVAIRLLVVAPTAQRTGLGRLLIGEVYNRARHAGARMLTVRVLPHGLGHAGHQNARDFYRNTGFVPLDDDNRGLLLGLPLPELEDWERDCA